MGHAPDAAAQLAALVLEEAFAEGRVRVSGHQHTLLGRPCWRAHAVAVPAAAAIAVRAAVVAVVVQDAPHRVAWPRTAAPASTARPVCVLLLLLLLLLLFLCAPLRCTASVFLVLSCVQGGRGAGDVYFLPLLRFRLALVEGGARQRERFDVRGEDGVKGVVREPVVLAPRHVLVDFSPLGCGRLAVFGSLCFLFLFPFFLVFFSLFSRLFLLFLRQAVWVFLWHYFRQFFWRSFWQPRI